MPIPTNPELLKMPFAADGDKNSIPETTSPTTGLFSQQYGFQSINSLPLTAGGKAISRLDWNGCMYMLSNLLYYMQRGYTFVYDDDMPYVQGCRVLDPNDGQVYNCVADAAAGAGAPSVTPANWELEPSADVLGFRKPDTAYEEGDIAFHPSLPTGYYLECTVAGTTSSGALSVGGGISVYDSLTDGTVTWTVCNVHVGAFNTKETFTTSGSFTAPVSGTYRITLQGGGGGGGGAGTNNAGIHNSGGGGGAGANYDFYATLIAGTSYSYVIGAGGSGGTAGSATTGQWGTAGGSGGDTSITIGNNTYAAGGGTTGNTTAGMSLGGTGGIASINGVSQGCFGMRGAQGTPGSVNIAGGSGGGVGSAYNSATFGAGGDGGSIFTSGTYNNGSTGGDGYITFEWFDPSEAFPAIWAELEPSE